MDHQSLLIEGVRVPRFLYGTAWKEEETQRLTESALQQGFRGIDTANQHRHYDEAAVGRSIAAALESGLLAKEQLFLQTQFTFLQGQDHRLPYDPKPQSRSRLSNPSPARSITWARESSIPSYSTDQPSGLA
jgi:diketogulonate reductase-like aldo/keto reductase